MIFAQDEDRAAIHPDPILSSRSEPVPLDPSLNPNPHPEESIAREGERAEVAKPPQSPPKSHAQPADTACVLVCTIMALLMTPAVGLFYSGMVRRKNALATFQKAFILSGVITLYWVLIGYSLAFNPDGMMGGVIGGLGWAGLSNVGLEPHPGYAPNIPHQLFATFQLAIAILAPALITGAIVDRMRFGPFLVFALLWMAFVYAPVTHWILSPEGWLNRWGALDFGGGLFVHVAAGFSALACAAVLGKRKGFGVEVLPPHNLLLTALGAALLGFGWLGWSVGNARGAGPSAVTALLTTLIAAGTSQLSWGLVEYLYEGRKTCLGTITGAVAGLVAITPASGYVSPFGAIAIGAAVGPICYAAMRIKTRLKVDDSLDVFAVNGIGGLVGVLALGVLAVPSESGTAHAGGLIYGKADLFLAQAMAVVAVAGFSSLATFALILAIDRLIGIPVLRSITSLSRLLGTARVSIGWRPAGFSRSSEMSMSPK